MDQYQSSEATLRARAFAVIPGGMWGHQHASRLPVGYPQYFASGQGCRTVDANGRSYIDYICAWGPMTCLEALARGVYFHPDEAMRAVAAEVRG